MRVELKKVVDNSYDIEIGRHLQNSLVKDLKDGLGGKINRYAIITDSNVSTLYGESLQKQLINAGLKVDLIVFPAGEKSKVREVKAEIEDEMLALGHRRDSMILAMGGGVVTDLAGFVAGTFGRGIPFINYSTSLLGAADASVGGKTAVDTPLATNLIGLIYQPKKVYIDLETWKTLPKEHISNGLAETIKHACLADATFFSYLEKHIDIILANNGLDHYPEVFEHIAKKNCEIKYRVVMQDEEETNLRQVLNLGHTIGRAIETLSDYTLLHGQAVSIGLALQAQIGEKLGYMSKNDVKRVLNLLNRANLPTQLPRSMTTHDVVQKLYTDKKVRGGRIRFVFEEGIGHMKRQSDGNYSVELREDVIEKLINSVR